MLTLAPGTAGYGQPPGAPYANGPSAARPLGPGPGGPPGGPLQQPHAPALPGHMQQLQLGPRPMVGSVQPVQHAGVQHAQPAAMAPGPRPLAAGALPAAYPMRPAVGSLSGPPGLAAAAQPPGPAAAAAALRPLVGAPGPRPGLPQVARGSPSSGALPNGHVAGPPAPTPGSAPYAWPSGLAQLQPRPAQPLQQPLHQQLAPGQQQPQPAAAAPPPAAAAGPDRKSVV